MEYKKIAIYAYLVVAILTISVLAYYAFNLHEPIHYIFALSIFIASELFIIFLERAKNKEMKEAISLSNIEHQEAVTKLKNEHHETVSNIKKGHQETVSQLNKEYKDHISLLYKCFPSFIDSFNIFCSESIKAIQQTKNDSKIFSIQTPLIPSEYNEGIDYFKAYIDSIVEQLLTKNIEINCSKISSFKRLIVINDKNDAIEIGQEKDKLQIFINSLFERVYSIDWVASLRNIEIGLIDANSMIASPLSHIDILLVLDSHLVIAFPKEKETGYEWGTSIHFNGNDEYNDFIHKMPIFSDLFNKVWNKPEVKKINLGEYYNHENWGSSRDKILEETNNLFKQILNIQ
ncbi:MAG: hypothetical protein K9I36_17035 [Bacteroidia bacterium]|nr:hypothetical protein [Bacteroidia bacterium]